MSNCVFLSILEHPCRIHANFDADVYFRKTVNPQVPTSHVLESPSPHVPESPSPHVLTFPRHRFQRLRVPRPRVSSLRVPSPTSQSPNLRPTFSHSPAVPESCGTAELVELNCLPNLIQKFDSDTVLLPCFCRT